MYRRWGEANVNSWWWVPIGLAAWFLVSLAVALCVGPVLRRSTEAREVLERQWARSDLHHRPPRDERQAAQEQRADRYTWNRNSVA